MAEKVIKAMDLFEAFAQDKLPKDKAYVVSSFINPNTGYGIYEVISYSGVKAIYPEGKGLTFQSSGKKMYMLIEPVSYPKKGTEPYLRDKGEQIPHRFSEVEVLTAKNQVKIMIGKKPNESLSSFTVSKPEGYNICFVFYDLPDIYKTLALFFEQSFNKDTGIPQMDAKKAAKEAAIILEKTMAFKADLI
jgi:hypothetical protein